MILFRDEAERLGIENVADVGDLEVWIYIICKQQNKDFDAELKRVLLEINEKP